MIERDSSGQYWVYCPKMQADTDIPTKIMIGACLECDASCKSKEALWDMFIPKEVDLSDSRLNMERYSSVKSGTKYCILKSHQFKDCFAKKRFCIFNEICPNKPYTGTTRSIRQRRVNMFAITTKEGELIIVDAKDLKSFPPDRIKDAYQITQAVRITTELVPYNDEGKDMNETIKAFINKYGGALLTKDGQSVTLKNWFNTADVNSIAFVVSNRLKPAKRIDVINIKKFMDDSSSADIQMYTEGDSNESKTKVPAKRIRRTREQIEAEKAIIKKIQSRDVPEPKQDNPKRTRRTKAEMAILRSQQSFKRGR